MLKNQINYSRPRPGLYQGRIIRPNLERGRSYDDWFSPADPDDDIKVEIFHLCYH